MSDFKKFLEEAKVITPEPVKPVVEEYNPFKKVIPVEDPTPEEEVMTLAEKLGQERINESIRKLGIHAGRLKGDLAMVQGVLELLRLE